MDRMNLWRGACAVLALAAGLVAAPAGAQVQYIHTDALGSVVAVTDANRDVIERREFAPYGDQLNAPAADRGPGYTGHVEDGLTGLTYMQQRYYDPAIGRFLSVDPVGPMEDPINHFGRYHYANNNPYKYIDPDGRQAFKMPQYMRDLMVGERSENPGRGELQDKVADSVESAVNEEIRTAPAQAAKAGKVTLLAISYSPIGAPLRGPRTAASIGRVTAEAVKRALAASTLRTTQRAVSLPVVENYVQRLMAGSRPPPIQLDGDIIVDGNHRYVASRLVGQEVPTVPGTVAPSQAVLARPVRDLQVDPTDWQNR